MSKHLNPVDVALAFTEAWTSHDLATAAAYVAEDVTFDGPINHLAGSEAYMQGLAAFAPAINGLRVVAAFGDDEQALIMYELSMGPLGSLRCAERLTVRGGKIQTDELTFDSYPVRQARATQAAPANAAA